MATSFDECPTGILIDFVENTNVSVSPPFKDVKGLEDDLNECNILKSNGKDQVFPKDPHEQDEESLACPTSISSTFNIFSNQCVELNGKKDKLHTSKSGWRTPSPKTMRLISRDASRIVDQLHSSSLEISLLDEVFPLPSYLEDECLEEFSNESEVFSHNFISKISDCKLPFCNYPVKSKFPLDHELVVKGCSFTVDESSIIVENPMAPVKNFATTENSRATAEISSVFSENSEAINEISTITKEKCRLSEESSGAAEESSEAAEESSGSAEKCSKSDKENSSVTAEYSNVFNEYDGVTLASSSVSAGASSMFAVDTDAKDCNLIAEVPNKEAKPIHTVIERKQASSEGTFVANRGHSTSLVSLSMKARAIKAFKYPIFKTPIKYNELKEKENIFQGCKDEIVLSEKKVSKIGKVPSAAKGILGESQINGVGILKSRSNLETPSKKYTKNFFFERGKNKSVKSMSQDLAKETLKQSNTPLDKRSTIQCQPVSTKKTPLCKSYSMRETPNLAKAIRRSSSFQAPNVENSNPRKKEKSFMVESRLKTMNSRMSMNPIPRTGNQLITPLKTGSFLSRNTPTSFAPPFTSKAQTCAKVSQITCPLYGSTLKRIGAPAPNSPHVVSFKRPASTSSRTRFSSRLELPTPLPKILTDNLPRRLFPDCNTTMKRL